MNKTLLIPDDSLEWSHYVVHKEEKRKSKDTFFQIHEYNCVQVSSY
jgi:hypothetical protein